MKLLLDENLSHRLVGQLVDLYPDSLHVRDAGFAGGSDERIWDYARDHGFLLVSKDADFYQRSILRGAPPKVVWLRIGNGSTSEIFRLLRNGYQLIQRFAADQEAAFLVLSSS